MLTLLQVIIQTILAYIGTLSFGIILNIPRRTLNRAGIVGAMAWLTYELVMILTQDFLDKNWRIILGSFIATIMIGMLSLTMSRSQKVPMLIYQIPGIFPLVPGGQAYQVVRSLVIGDRVTATTNFELLVIIISAIATGFWSAELINQLRGMKRLT